MVGFFIVFHHILFVISARLLSLKAETPDIQRKRGNFNFLSVSAKNIRLLFQRYKALILKYKPYISKYMACIFYFSKCLMHNNLQWHFFTLANARFFSLFRNISTLFRHRIGKSNKLFDRQLLRTACKLRICKKFRMVGGLAVFHIYLAQKLL